MVKKYNVNGLAGCVQQTHTRSTDTLVGVYHTAQAGMDQSIGTWSVVCEVHGAIAGYSGISMARNDAGSPEDWCDECRGTT